MTGAMIYVDILNLQNEIKSLDKDIDDYYFIGKKEQARSLSKKKNNLMSELKILLETDYKS